MAKPYIHAESSARKFGGKPEDYLKIHNWFDQTKAHFPDMRHRAILHSSFGIFLCEQVFGEFITNSVNQKVSVRDIGEQHILEDMKMKSIPTIQDYLCEMNIKDWMMGNGYPPSCQKNEEKQTEKVQEKLHSLEDKNKKQVFFDGSKLLPTSIEIDDPSPKFDIKIID